MGAERWLGHILSVPCPPVDPSDTKRSGCGEPAGQLCGTGIGATVDYICAARVRAAEDANQTHLTSRHKFPRMDITWQHGRWTKTCKRCGALTSGETGHAYYSHDNGATWTPGPDACPGRGT